MTWIGLWGWNWARTIIYRSLSTRANSSPEFARSSVAALADLFRPFYRVADARDRQTGGIGLGLAITDRAVRLHGGTVTAANAPDGGLIVKLQLPTAPTS